MFIKHKREKWENWEVAFGKGIHQKESLSVVSSHVICAGYLVRYIVIFY